MKPAGGSGTIGKTSGRPPTPPVYKRPSGRGVQQQRIAVAPPVYRPAQASAVFPRVAAPPVYRPPQGARIQQQTAIPAVAPQLVSARLTATRSTTVPGSGNQGYRPPQSPAARPRITVPPVYRPVQALPAQRQTPVPAVVPPAGIQNSVLQTFRKSGKRQHKLNQRSEKKRAAQSARDRADAKDAQARKLQNGNLYSGLDEDETAWDIAKAATQAELPQDLVPKLKADSSSLQNMGLEADTRFSKTNILVRYDEEAPTDQHHRRIGRLAQTFTHELYVHGRHGLGRDDPDQDHDEMHDPATRDEYLDITKQALARLQHRAQQRAFLHAWKLDMLFQIKTATDLTDTERRKRRLWVDTTYRQLLPP